jgi:hypothetical protein
MDPEVQAVVEALRRYVSDNPFACDASSGIARWWLQGRFAPAQVERALAELHARGELERLSAADGRVRWRMTRKVAP